MPAKLWYSKLTPTTYAATTAATGYPASNVGLESLGRPWRATGVGATDVTINLASASLVEVLHLHDVNFTTATIQKSVSGGAFVTVGTITCSPNEHGRYRGYLTISEPLCTAIKIQIGAGSAVDGLAYWRIGSAYLFANVVTLADGIQYGAEVETQEAVLQTVLVNNRKAEARTGYDKDLIRLPFKIKNTDSLQDIIRRTRLGSCLFSMEVPNYPENVWPVTRQQVASVRNFWTINRTSRPVELTEVV